jgi:hypothetical protein
MVVSKLWNKYDHLGNHVLTYEMYYDSMREIVLKEGCCFSVGILLELGVLTYLELTLICSLALYEILRRRWILKYVIE